jgi:hypothetical protein
MDMSEMANLVNTMISKQAPIPPKPTAAPSGGAEKKRRGGRLQHSWAK